MKNALIVIFAVLLLLFGATIIHTENQRYALAQGLCPNLYQESVQEHNACLFLAETRTHDSWHLYYALRETLQLP
ncbi:hypothetical protein ACFMBG_03525 [Leisingera sp. D0M16]|uniref:hypothetical protein n=1 Tax=Leisingera coralii TaxID=3351347 RepID=UPI003B78BD58